MSETTREPKWLVLLDNNPELAKAYSKAFWSLCAPADGSGETQYLTGWREHPETNQVALYLPNEPYRLKATATPEPILELLTEKLPAEKKEGLSVQLKGLCNAQASVYLEDLIPVEFTALILTENEMKNAGWFNDSTI
jgi:hypothetical protein